jgi:predicted metalloprotease with PDZ domain
MDRHSHLFLVTAVGEGYGGLEHRASAALLCARDDLPQPGMKAPAESYRTFLGLASHEYFHSWNVKRIKPAAFVPYDLARENYTRLLWLFEGCTSYMTISRSALASSRDQYLEILGRNITSHLRTGAHATVAAESSFDAWTRDAARTRTRLTWCQPLPEGSLVAVPDLLIRDRTRDRGRVASRSTTSCARCGAATDCAVSALPKATLNISRRK